MGESTNPRGKLRFDRRIRLEFHGATITSGAGLVGDWLRDILDPRSHLRNA